MGSRVCFWHVDERRTLVRMRGKQSEVNKKYGARPQSDSPQQEGLAATYVDTPNRMETGLKKLNNKQHILLHDNF